MVQHVINIEDFSKEWLLDLFSLTDKIRENPQDYQDLLKGKQLGTAFYENSTRTRLSFVSAMNNLGGKSEGFGSSEGTSIKKGETLHHTIKMLDGYFDAIVLRHTADGAARLAAEHSRVPVINGGDGSRQHPTQTMLDLYTIQREFGKLEGRHLAIAGDLKYGRTTHSLLYGANIMGLEVTLISPKELMMPKKFLGKARKMYESEPRHYESLDDALESNAFDVLYMTRIQRERFTDEREYQRVAGTFTLDEEVMEKATDDMIVMHPLPIKGADGKPEISFGVDHDSRAKYFEQAENGRWVRTALLYKLLVEEEVQHDSC